MIIEYSGQWCIKYAERVCEDFLSQKDLSDYITVREDNSNITLGYRPFIVDEGEEPVRNINDIEETKLSDL